MVRMRLLALALSIGLLAPAAAQQAQPGPGQILGNPTASQSVARPSDVTAILDRALGSTRGSIIERGASGWAIIGPSATTGLAWVSQGAGADPLYGVVGLAGGGCGAALTASNGGVLYSTASTCAVLAGTANASRPLLSGSSTTPSWGAFSLPASVTSGGIPYFSSTSAMASSALLAANQIVFGGGAGVAPATGLGLGTTTTLLHGNAAGLPTWASVTSSDLAITTTTCTNQFVSAIAANGTATCTTDTLAGAQHANQGTTTTVLHGNAAGNPSWTSIVFADLASGMVATAAQYLSGAASVLVPASVIYQTETTTTFGTTTTFDFSTFINTAVTLTANITTMSVSNVKAGQAGTITFIQDGTGSRTTVFNSVFKFTAGAAPTLSTAASAIDVLSYSCRTTTFCVASLLKDVR
jgi:hypothetical protein